MRAVRGSRSGGSDNDGTNKVDTDKASEGIDPGTSGRWTTRARAVLGRRRRAWQIAIFVTTPGVVLGAGTVAGAYGLGIVGHSTVACTPVVVRAPARATFDVRVHNASGVDRRAGGVAKDLTKRGFKVVEVTGVPKGKMQTQVDIAYGRAGLDAALLLAGQVPGAQLVNDGRQGKTVSLVIGDSFTGLVPVPAAPPPHPSQVTVNVYNATFRSGLAGQVGAQLATRGFREGKTGNDPQRSFLPDDTAVIRYGEDGAAAAAVLAQHVPKAVLTKVDRTDKTVDIVLGNDYSALIPAAMVPKPAPVKPTPPETVTRPCPTR